MPRHDRLDVTDSRTFGAIVCESLRPGSSIEGFDLTVVRLSRYDIGEPASGQPSRWTLLEFDAPAASADDLASRLSDALLDEGGWYANFSTTDEAFVIFAGKVFRYSRSDPDDARRAGAEEYGRSKGVPEPQLDWSE